MHHIFDPSKVTVKQLKLKSINTTGGFITYYISDNFNKTERMDCSITILNQFSKTYKIGTNYTIPVHVCIMTYEGLVVAIEKSPFNSGTYIAPNNTVHDWIPGLTETYNKVLNLLNPDHTWFFDGSYIYSFMSDELTAINNGTNLTEIGTFKAVKAKAVYINYIGFIDEVYLEDRQCLGFLSNNEYSITTPIWKTLSQVGNANMKKTNTEVLKLETQFDKIDNLMLVNLQFAIYAGITLTRQFGYRIIEPLQLPRLMMQLKTVNLQSIPTGTRQTFDIGLTFTQAMAWLLGINKAKNNTFQDMLIMKKLFRYLTMNGIYCKSVVNNVFKDESHDVPLLNIEDMLKDFK